MLRIIGAARLAAALFLLAAALPESRVAAAVLPHDRITAIFASAKNIHRKPSPDASISDPYYVVDNSDAQGFVDDDSLDYGYLANGADVFIVPLGSGGSGGVFFTLLFTSVATKPHFVGYVPSPSGHLDVHIDEGKIMVTTPIYRGNDPNCCPSGHHIINYTLSDGKLKALDERDVK